MITFDGSASHGRRSSASSIGLPSTGLALLVSLSVLAACSSDSDSGSEPPDDGVVVDMIRLDNYVALIELPLDFALDRANDALSERAERFTGVVDPLIPDPASVFFAPYDVTTDCPAGGSVNGRGSTSPGPDSWSAYDFDLCAVEGGTAEGTISYSSSAGGREQETTYDVLLDGVETPIGFGSLQASGGRLFSCDACADYSLDFDTYRERTSERELSFSGTGNFREEPADAAEACTSGRSGSASAVSLGTELSITSTDLTRDESIVYSAGISLGIVETDCDGTPEIRVRSVGEFLLLAEDGSSVSLEPTGAADLFDVTLTDSAGMSLTDTVRWTELVSGE